MMIMTMIAVRTVGKVNLLGYLPQARTRCDGSTPSHRVFWLYQGSSKERAAGETEQAEVEVKVEWKVESAKP
jgi:hypothetical protein